MNGNAQFIIDMCKMLKMSYTLTELSIVLTHYFFMKKCYYNYDRFVITTHIFLQVLRFTVLDPYFWPQNSAITTRLLGWRISARHTIKFCQRQIRKNRLRFWMRKHWNNTRRISVLQRATCWKPWIIGLTSQSRPSSHSWRKYLLIFQPKRTLKKILIIRVILCLMMRICSLWRRF